MIETDFSPPQDRRLEIQWIGGCGFSPCHVPATFVSIRQNSGVLNQRNRRPCARLTRRSCVPLLPRRWRTCCGAAAISTMPLWNSASPLTRTSRLHLAIRAEAELAVRADFRARRHPLPHPARRRLADRTHQAFFRRLARGEKALLRQGPGALATFTRKEYGNGAAL